MLRVSCTYCADCAAPLRVLHEALPPLNRSFTSHSPLVNLDSSAAPPSFSARCAPTRADWSSVDFAVAGQSRNIDGNALKHQTHSPVLPSRPEPESSVLSDGGDSSKLHGTDNSCPTKTNTPSGVDLASCVEGVVSSSLHGSFVLLSPLPGAGYSQNIVVHDGLEVANSDFLAEDHLRQEENNSSSSGPACQTPCDVLGGELDREDLGRRIAARLAQGDKWSDLGLEDATLCEQCFSATMSALNEQLEQEKALLLRYKKALRFLKRTKKKGQAQDDGRKKRCERENKEVEEEHQLGDVCGSQKRISGVEPQGDAQRPGYKEGERGGACAPQEVLGGLRSVKSLSPVHLENMNENGDRRAEKTREENRGDTSDCVHGDGAGGFLTPREQLRDRPSVQAETEEREAGNSGDPLGHGEAWSSQVTPHSASADAPTKAREKKERVAFLREIVAAAEEREEGQEEEKELLHELLGLDLLHLQLCLLSTSRQGQLARQEESTAAMLRQRDYVRGQVQRLKRLNVMNDAFHIWTDEALPSINSCRIGRVAGPSCPSWAEINSGWGHMCLLVDVLFRKVYVHPTHYRLVPRGPYSYLVRKKDDSLLPLQGRGGDGGFSRFFYSNRRFDAATVAFLECVQELYEALTHFARQPWPPYAPPGAHTPLEPPELPFAIDGDRIGGFCIRLQLSQDERWTQAVKYLLIDLKWLLGYVEKVCVVLPSFT